MSLKLYLYGMATLPGMQPLGAVLHGSATPAPALLSPLLGGGTAWDATHRALHYGTDGFAQGWRQGGDHPLGAVL